MQQPGPRTKAREFAFKFIYQFQLPELKNNTSSRGLEGLDRKLAEFHASYSEKDSEHPDNSLNKEAKDFSKDIIQETLTHWTELEEWISSKAKGWSLDRMDKVDLSILMICTSELKFLKHSPSPIIINEAVNLAKKFGTANSSAFINGVLDALAQD